MKTVLNTNPVFDPSLKTLNFSGVSGFKINRLLAVLDQTKNTIIYATTSPGLGYTAWNSGTSVLTLEKDTTTGGFNSADSLTCIYDDSAPLVTIGSSPALVASVTTGNTINSSLLKSGATTIFGIQIVPKPVDTGVGCFPAYLKLYNSASPTVGTTTPTLTFCIIDESGKYELMNPIPAGGISFSAAVSYAVTAGVLPTDTTVPQAGHLINFQYI